MDATGTRYITVLVLYGTDPSVSGGYDNGSRFWTGAVMVIVRMGQVL